VPGGDRVDIAVEDVERCHGFEVIADAFLVVDLRPRHRRATASGEQELTGVELESREVDEAPDIAQIGKCLDMPP
jgi:hypothetical protein